MIDERIADAARAAGRNADDITRIVVTKFHPASLVDELSALGVGDVGENRQQELSAKVGEVRPAGPLRWHFIGQAQTNKARAVRAAASVVHTVDRARLADALDRAAEPSDDPLDVLVQVNLTDDADRGGVSPEGLDALAAHVAGCRTLRLRGIMAVAPLDEEPARAFARLHGYAERLRAIVPDARWISAGMTGDFIEAIDAGATHLRIGSAITGPRPLRG
ncbi:YggS family pyridoxal phosphate-dependent enzyme [Microbacterium sp. cx-55]|uniref:YggS family pyridoxal phosphate-dependent enzyme n=1 Tax=unclassified Microbacterium TaxID=2609290 RepID=UPI001CBBAE95|nr:MULTISPECIES: YggS family pyridoxal phosphate-dependent enzyme [unclassified Microbacterium]MBZ4486637.1 YggS family pyridoxal phosphate-dependent enzyme [Microbacterium sp. cx-55]MCC4907605.1 YggS family pyridoxal phosphate-dependent enzyme [Microbacterium sp. cx-59]UGB36682.1 YggS family pyridoxal phosphate-dependent enzyme [Microbacterium sp. cx-55]